MSDELRTATGRFLRRVSGLTVEFRDSKPYLPVHDDWVGDLEAGYRAVIAARPDSPNDELRDIMAAHDELWPPPSDGAAPEEAWVADAWAARSDFEGRVRAALAARPDSPTRDVERLAALDDAMTLHYFIHPDTLWTECDGTRCVRRRNALAAKAPERPA